MRRYPKKLKLSRETIQRLDPSELQRVAGAATTPLCLPPTHYSTCPSFKPCPTQVAELSCLEFCTPSEAGQC
jgi:hypothetical protein